MATTPLTDEALLAILDAHPSLRERIASMVSAVENADGMLKTADAIEERVVEEVRHLGREVIQSWAERQVAVSERDIRQQPQTHRQGKKNSAGRRSSAPSRSSSRSTG
jgi:hypothetical protein